MVSQYASQSCHQGARSERYQRSEFEFGSKECAHVHWIAPVEPDSGLLASDKAMPGCLSGEELERMRSLVQLADRRRFLVSRQFLRRTLSRYAPVALGDWRFVRGASGCLSIAGGLLPGGLPLDFNLSHSRQAIAVVVTPGFSAGIDVEELVGRETVESLAGLALTVDEQSFVWGGANDGEVRQRFTQIWTLKEAYLKALRCGLPGGPKWVGFGGFGDEVRLVQASPLDPDPTGWTFAAVGRGNFQLAVAVMNGLRKRETVRWMEC